MIVNWAYTALNCFEQMCYQLALANRISTLEARFGKAHCINKSMTSLATTIARANGVAMRKYRLGRVVDCAFVGLLHNEVVAMTVIARSRATTHPLHLDAISATNAQPLLAVGLVASWRPL